MDRVMRCSGVNVTTSIINDYFHVSGRPGVFFFSSCSLAMVFTFYPFIVALNDMEHLYSRYKKSHSITSLSFLSLMKGVRQKKNPTTTHCLCY